MQSMNGDWHLAYIYGGEAYHSQMKLVQKDNQFSGQGFDEATQKPFTIEGGKIDGSDITFYKRYQAADPSQMVEPIQYRGKIKVNPDDAELGTYWTVTGEYATSAGGQASTEGFEIEPQHVRQILDARAAQPAGQPVGQTGASQEGMQTQEQVSPEKAPHLSGKWDVAYEYKFKTIKSTMFIEQDGGKFTGHGQDINTREKFTIEKGFYTFPVVSYVRRYSKDDGAASNRTMAFKGEVTMVNDKDYHGPYLSGKTEGGGAWEAEQFR